QTYYQSPVLDPGEHNLAITAGSASPDFLLDFFLVTSPELIQSPQGSTATDTQPTNIFVPIAATIGGIFAIIWIVKVCNRGQRKPSPVIAVERQDMQMNLRMRHHLNQVQTEAQIVGLQTAIVMDSFQHFNDPSPPPYMGDSGQCQPSMGGSGQC
ncbi:hypothetical protein AX17_005432, partial [Amanita inopinata Kibby_2008]